MSVLTPYLNHPEKLDHESLYALRTLVARHPSFVAARLLLLHNLFILHDATFSEELRKTAFLIPDRRVLFDLVEADKYHIEPEPIAAPSGVRSERTLQVIDSFLHKTGQTETMRQPTVADATTDYAAFLLSLEDAPEPSANVPNTPQDTTAQLVDKFLADGKKLTLNTHDETSASTEPAPEVKQKKSAKKNKESFTPQDDNDDSFFTETLAKIYIKQGRFEKALEIISTLQTNFPNKSIYFADQMRYLRKLILNNQHKQ